MNKILIIDDNNEFRESYKSLLTNKGYECHGANNGLSGLVKTAEISPDIILLDVDLPDIDGLEVCRRIKTHPETRSIPVVFISGFDKYLKQQLYCLDIGGDAYIDKPFQNEELFSIIESLISKKQYSVNDDDKKKENISGIDEQLPQKVFGGYKILEFVGTGWMCTVYKTLQFSLNRVVALNVMSRTLNDDLIFKKYFEQETKVLASISHPNIVSIIDKGKEGDFYYYTSEFIDGKSLGLYFKTKELSPLHYVHIISELGNAVNYLHKNGIIQRFLNPNRIFIDSRGAIKLYDFAFTISGELFKKQKNFLADDHEYINYQAPEVRACVPGDACADVYSLGAIFYEMITGHKISSTILPPSSLNPELSKKTDIIILKALEDDPQKRYPSVIEFCRNLMTVFDKSARKSITNITDEENMEIHQNIFENLPDKRNSPKPEKRKTDIYKAIEPVVSGNIYKYLYILLFTLFIILLYLTFIGNKSSNKNSYDKKSVRLVPIVKFSPILNAVKGESIDFEFITRDADSITLFYRTLDSKEGFKPAEFFHQTKDNRWVVTIPAEDTVYDNLEYYIQLTKNNTSITFPPAAKTPFILTLSEK